MLQGRHPHCLSRTPIPEALLWAPWEILPAILPPCPPTTTAVHDLLLLNRGIVDHGYSSEKPFKRVFTAGASQHPGPVSALKGRALASSSQRARPAPLFELLSMAVNSLCQEDTPTRPEAHQHRHSCAQEALRAWAALYSSCSLGDPVHRVLDSCLLWALGHGMEMLGGPPASEGEREAEGPRSYLLELA